MFRANTPLEKKARDGSAPRFSQPNHDEISCFHVPAPVWVWVDPIETLPSSQSEANEFVHTVFLLSRDVVMLAVGSRRTHVNSRMLPPFL